VNFAKRLKCLIRSHPPTGTPRRQGRRAEDAEEACFYFLHSLRSFLVKNKSKKCQNGLSEACAGHKMKRFCAFFILKQKNRLKKDNWSEK